MGRRDPKKLKSRGWLLVHGCFARHAEIAFAAIPLTTHLTRSLGSSIAMSGALTRKRKLSEVAGIAADDLVVRPSPHHPAVTLFELKTEDIEDFKPYLIATERQATPKFTRSRSTKAVAPRTSTSRSAKLAKLEPSSPDLNKSATSSSRLLSHVTENALQTGQVIKKEEPLSDLSDLEDMELGAALLDLVSPSPGVAILHTSSKSGSLKRAKPIQMDLVVPHPAPDRWRVVYDTIREMRKGIVAPVDTTGHHMAGQTETDPKVCTSDTSLCVILNFVFFVCRSSAT